MFNCLNCSGDIDLTGGLNVWCGDDVTCPHCGHEMEMEFDMYYDPETFDESHFYWLINKEK